MFWWFLECVFFSIVVFFFLHERRFYEMSYRVKGGSYLRGGRSSNEIRCLTKHYYLTKWRPQIKSLRLFNDFLPLFHVHVWYWFFSSFFFLFQTTARESWSCLVILLFYDLHHLMSVKYWEMLLILLMRWICWREWNFRNPFSMRLTSGGRVRFMNIHKLFANICWTHVKAFKMPIIYCSLFLMWYIQVIRFEEMN